MGQRSAWEVRTAMSPTNPHVAAFAEIFGAPPAGFAVPVDWEAVETWLGTALPADYKAVASAYGPLDIGEHLWLHTPHGSGTFDYGTWAPETRREAPGVLAVGETRRCDTLFWDTTASDDPDQWPVVMHCPDHRDGSRDVWRRFGAPLVPTLARLVAEGLRPVAVRSRVYGELESAAWTPPRRRPEPTARQRAALTSGSGLRTLTALVPPPPAPVLGERGWEWLYDGLGTRLPEEYVRLMETYGAGCWTGWLRFKRPLSEHQYALAPWATWYSGNYVRSRTRFPEFHSLAVWPEPGGFLPFADSIDGDQLCWLTEGDTPEDWPLIVVPRHADEGPPLRGRGLADTLLDWLRGGFATEGLPRLGRDDEDPLDYIGFEPYPVGADGEG
ncbi:SMI1/KNR4 family protein [Streptomyces sp. MAR4 CNX-425]|uniref:SMI1/KNR4 family protein n=1 Tax=Streptomyces sp. MAR4 CNX-425 TaxID=3406343 RepID=UPI003B504C72